MDYIQNSEIVLQFGTDIVFQWRLVLEEYIPDEYYIIGKINIVAYSL